MQTKSNNSQISKCATVLCLGLLLLFMACVNQKSATKYFDKHTDKGSGYCAAKYPVHVGGAKVSEQDWSDTTDSYVVPSETPVNDYNLPIVHDTATRIINHYHKITDSIPYIDSALAHSLRLQLLNALQTNATLQNTVIANDKDAKARYAELKAENNSNKKYRWGFFGILSCIIAWRYRAKLLVLIKRLFTRLINK